MTGDRLSLRPVCDDGEGIRPDAARPPDLRHDGGGAADAVALFGFAINSDPRDLPTAVLDADHGPRRAPWWPLENTTYFRVTGTVTTRPRPTRCCAGQGAVRGRHPARFLARGWRAATGRPCWSRPTPPTLAATSGRSAPWRLLARPRWRDLSGPPAIAAAGPPPFDLRSTAATIRRRRPSTTSCPA